MATDFLPESQVEEYLHKHIPLSAAMGVSVRLATPQRVELTAPLAPNINHRHTVFGGSASALATLSAWTLLHVRMHGARVDARLVIQRNTMSYEAFISGDFAAICVLSDEAPWRRFLMTFERRGRARITLAAHLVYAARRVASFEGDFVALRD